MFRRALATVLLIPLFMSCGYSRVYLWACENCPDGWICDNETCYAPFCKDQVFDSADGETDLDCGGPCFPCQVGQRCAIGSDCEGGVCLRTVCQEPSCKDGVQNEYETGVDCGNGLCPACPAGEGCIDDGNCASRVCRSRVCQEPSCKDGVKNGEELGKDCGGPCPACAP